MKIKVISWFFTAAISLVVMNGFAQEKGQKINPGISKFAKSLGTWHSNFNSTTNGKTQVLDYTVVFSSVADGNGVYMEETAKGPEAGTYHAGNIIGYDQYDKKLHWYTVDNTGVAHDHIVTWKGDNHYSFVHNGVRNGKKYSENLEGTFKGENSMEIVYTAKLDGKVTEKSQGTFERTAK